MALYEDEIDLRPYILALIRFGWLILLAAIFLGGLIFLFLRSKPPMYSSTASILLTRGRPQFELTEQLPTVRDTVDPAVRLASIRTVLESDSFAQKVAKDLASRGILPADTDVEALRSRVQLANQGDILSVTASAGTSEEAAEVANAWAGQAVQTINLIYMEEQPLEQIQAQLRTARDEYQANQAALESFIAGNDRALLDAELVQARRILASVAAERSSQVLFYTERKQAMEILAAKAETLRQQLEAGSVSTAAGAGDALAVLQARALSYNLPVTSSSGLTLSADNTNGSETNDSKVDLQAAAQAASPLTVNVQVTDLAELQAANQNAVQDAGRLIELAQAEAAKAEEELARLTQEILSGDQDPQAAQAAGRVQGLQAALEASQAKERDLTNQRDVSADVYKTLVEKESEVRNGAQYNNYANLAAPAFPPEAPNSSGAVKFGGFGAVLGLVLAAGIVLLSQWWKSFKAAAPRTTEPAKTA